MNFNKQIDKQKVWLINEPDSNKVNSLIEATGISSLTAKVLVNRGVTADIFEEFNTPNLSYLLDPFLIKDMEKAVSRIRTAISSGEKILIYGDYDVDGITATSALLLFLRRINANVGYFIPDRHVDGYGLSINALKKVISDGYDLIITVDCGITGFEEVNYLKEQGIDIIITDHHTCKEEIPDAYAVVSPCRHDCNYPCKYLAGVGVAFKVMQALSLASGKDDLYLDYIDLVALGTVADMVSVNGENRVIITEGINMMQSTNNEGLKALINVISADKSVEINTWTIGFLLAPRINAAGRMGSASVAVEMLTTDSKQRANEIATQLHLDNKFRQETELTIFNEACSIIENDPNYEDENILVVSREGWHQGVIGIVASKLSEKYWKPVVMIAVDGENGKGSSRSIGGFHLFNALNACVHLLLRFGGHEAAAGLSISTEKIQEFRRAINEFAKDNVEDYKMIPRLAIDAEIELQELTLQNIIQLEQLSPFGIDNVQPIFACMEMEIRDIRKIGADQNHLKLILKKGDYSINAVGFNLAYQYNQLKNSDKINAAFYVEKNVWNGNITVQLKIVDFKRSFWGMIEEKYYASFETILPFFKVGHVNNSNYVATDLILNKECINEINSSEDTVVLINDLVSTKELLDFMKDTINKDTLCQLYINDVVFWFNDNFHNNNGNKLTVCLNPVPENNKRFNGAKVILLGCWTNKAYKEEVISSFSDNSIIDLTQNCPDSNEDFAPDRKYMRCIYQFVIRCCKEVNPYITSFEQLASDLNESYRIPINFIKIKLAIKILIELDLISVEIENEMAKVTLHPKPKKDGDLLDKSTTYNWLNSL